MLSLNYKTYGEGPAFIILHGLMGQLDNWQTIGKKLAEDYTVYLVDQRNHGRSPHTEEHNYKDMAEDINNFLDSQGIPSATILGHSMGGKAAMQFAYDYEDRVDRLIVIDIAPKQYEPHHNDVFEAFKRVPIDKVTSRKEVEAIIRETITDNGNVQFLMKNLTRDGDTYTWKMNLPVLDRDYANIIAPTVPIWPMEVETLFIRGGDSSYILDTDIPEIKEYFPNSTVETISGAGHWVQAQKPKEVLQLIS